MSSSNVTLATGVKKSLILNAFVEMCSGHHSPGLWQHPDDRSAEFNTLDHWVELAKMLEDAKFHGIFIADVLGGYDVFNGDLSAAIKSGAQWPVNEPLAVISAMASVTRSLGFGVTVATTYEQPYHLARRLSTIDHLTGGRIGWNIVTGYLESAARNLGLSQLPMHDERYEIAEEYIRVMYKLFESSWRDDAVVLDKARSMFVDPSRVRKIHHVGKYYTVPGPHICQPSPQRTPVLLQAGTSRAGKAFAAQHAEVVFVAGLAPSIVAKNIEEVRSMAEGFGRKRNDIKFLAMICPIVGQTQEAAKDKWEDYVQYVDMDGAMALFGGWTGVDLSKLGDEDDLLSVESNAIRSAVEAWSTALPGIPKWTKAEIVRNLSIGALGAYCIGSPSQVADEFERWVREADVDGFNISYAVKPATFVDVAELLIPELRKRGVFWEDYTVPGGTYRENVYGKEGQKGPLDQHIAAKYRWKSNVEANDAIIPE